MRRVALAVLAVLLLPSLAHADLPSPSAGAAAVSRPPASWSAAPPPEPAHAPSYLGTMLIGSLLPAVGIVAAAKTESSGLAVVSAAVYVLSGPVVHGISDQSFGRVGLSAVLRVGLPIGAVLVSNSRHDCHGDDECDDDSGRVIVAGVAGVAAATAIDLVLAAIPGEGRHARSRRGLTPTMAPQNGGVSLGLGGTF
jgi:hypothetical protein